MDAASAAVATVSGVAPIAAAEDDGLSDDTPHPHFVSVLPDEQDEADSLIEAIDAERAYRAAVSVLRREGMVGLLLNRTA